LRRATEVPLATARAAARVVGLARETAEGGVASAVTDAGTAAALAEAAFRAASWNALVNLGGISDKGFADRVRSEVSALSRSVADDAGATRSAVERDL
ncbi:MAG: cyclodeaminase/cyclohydrolase family protein, partial [Methanobacteriota archaeon]